MQGTLFNEEISACDFAANVDCTTGGNTGSGAPTGQGDDNGTPDFEPVGAEEPTVTEEFILVDNPVDKPPPPRPWPGMYFRV